MDTLFQDLKYGLRMLAKNPGFTVVAVITLALGIGANATVFSLVNAVLLRPLPGVEQPERLVQLGRSHLKQGARIYFDTVSYPNYKDYRDQNQAFSGLLAYRTVDLDLNAEDGTERIRRALVTGNYFDVLGVKPVTGRTFLPEEDRLSDPRSVAVLSNGLWKRRFGQDPNLLGREIRINGHALALIGIAPEDFKGTEVGHVIDVWVPIAVQAQVVPRFLAGWVNLRDASWLQVIGRLKPGLDLKQAQAAMDTLARQLEQQYPTANKGVGVTLDPHVGLWPGDRVEAANFSGLLMAVAGLVLLIACANVANLFLARSVTRRREIAVRLALGAARWRLIRQLLTEGILLGLAAGALGLLAAFWTAGLLSALPVVSNSLPQLDLRPDAHVLIFTLASSLVASLMFSLAPALVSSKPDLVPTLKETSVTQRVSKSRLRTLLVTSQIALSLALLVGAGLLIRTLINYQAINPGFEVRNILALSLDVGSEGYTETRGRIFYQQFLQRVEALPGVRATSLSLYLPISGKGYGTCVVGEGREPSRDQPCFPTDYLVVTPSYFSTLNMPLVEGRGFSDQDGPQASRVAIINETMAHRLWPRENPTGKILRWWNRQGSGPVFEVVGVVKDTKYRALKEEPRLVLYLPFLQRYEPAMTFLARTATSPMAILPAVRSEVQSLDKNLATFNARTLSEHIEASLSQQRSAATLVGLFGFLALVLAAVGLYGVMSYLVTERTHEIGIRVALGARPPDVLKMVLRDGLRLALIGTGIGFAVTLIFTRILQGMLFGVKPTDPVTFAGVGLLLTATALLACYLPARRATKVDPMVALRYE